MKSDQLSFRPGFRLSVGNARSQAAVMVLPAGGKEGGPDNNHRGADQWLFVVEGTGTAIIRKDGGSDGRGVGFYFRNVTEIILFGVRGKNARTLQPGRTQVNLLATRKREHSRKPDEQYPVIEACSPGPFLELFARGIRKNWATWGNEAGDSYEPTWDTYAHHSQAEKKKRKNGAQDELISG